MNQLLTALLISRKSWPTNLIWLIPLSASPLSVWCSSRLAEINSTSPVRLMSFSSRKARRLRKTAGPDNRKTMRRTYGWKNEEIDKIFWSSLPEILFFFTLKHVSSGLFFIKLHILSTPTLACQLAKSVVLIQCTSSRPLIRICRPDTVQIRSVVVFRPRSTDGFWNFEWEVHWSDISLVLKTNQE